LLIFMHLYDYGSLWLWIFMDVYGCLLMFMDAIACCLMPFLGHLPLQEGKKSESARAPRGLRNSNIGIGETRTGPLIWLGSFWTTRALQRSSAIWTALVRMSGWAAPQGPCANAAACCSRLQPAAAGCSCIFFALVSMVHVATTRYWQVL
jgi:hypothetical protein